jgi:hypothetical protein
MRGIEEDRITKGTPIQDLEKGVVRKHPLGDLKIPRSTRQVLHHNSTQCRSTIRSSTKCRNRPRDNSTLLIPEIEHRNKTVGTNQPATNHPQSRTITMYFAARITTTNRSPQNPVLPPNPVLLQNPVPQNPVLPPRGVSRTSAHCRPRLRRRRTVPRHEAPRTPAPILIPPARPGFPWRATDRARR